MTQQELTQLLGGWEGYRLEATERHEASEPGGRPEVWLTLEPDEQRCKRCSGCGEVVQAVHDSHLRCIRDLPILDANTWLRVRRCRLEPVIDFQRLPV